MGNYNPGGIPFSTQTLTITDRSGASQSYVADAFSLTDPSDWFVRKAAGGAPGGQVGVDAIPTGSITLQLEDEDTKLPKKFAEFEAIESGEDTPVTLVIAEVGQARDIGDMVKVTISVRAVIN
jgi:hypothetical protein